MVSARETNGLPAKKAREKIKISTGFRYDPPENYKVLRPSPYRPLTENVGNCIRVVFTFHSKKLKNRFLSPLT